MKAFKCYFVNYSNVRTYTYLENIAYGQKSEFKLGIPHSIEIMLTNEEI